MPILRGTLLSLLLMLMATPAVVCAQAAPEAAQKDARTLWADFNHYVRIRRLDLAQASAAALRDVTDEALLEVVETSQYQDWQQTLVLASRIDEMRELASELSARIQNAKIARSREKERILADIRALASGPRGNMLATDRLRAAGQYAAPHLLGALLNDREQELHPYILAAMVEVGRPMVYPLAEALPDLEPVPLGQVAKVLAAIGYPRSLPYLKQVIEDERTDPSARAIVQRAFEELANRLQIPTDVSAAELFLTLGENLYASANDFRTIPGFDPAVGQGVVWEYTDSIGLVPIMVPGEIYADVLALRAARRSLRLNPALDQSLSLLLMANSRRENRLPEGAVDISYPEGWVSPAFYLKAAGPLRQHDVLHQALRDSDTPLALDAINALMETAGTDALINRGGAVQPLLESLSYPDRRVRFNAAMVMAQSRPDSEFPGSHRVVPVLAEAVRQTDQRHALVLADKQETINDMIAMMSDLGFTAFGGIRLEDVADQLNAAPGVDLVVVRHAPDQVQQIYHETVLHYKLAAVPILAVATAAEEIDLKHRFADVPRVRAAVASASPDDLRSAVEQASESYAGQAIETDEALEFALRSLALLKEIALSNTSVFRVTDAQPALVLALQDRREEVVAAAAQVLALIDNAVAQRAIAEVALDSLQPLHMQVSLLSSLAASATAYGNQLTQEQMEKVLDLVKSSQASADAPDLQELAETAARVHGALTLPTSNIKQMLISEE